MYHFWKRVFDIFSASIALVLILPLLAVISVVIKLNSRGPVLYKGVRTGLNAKPFRILKFRTMVPNAEQLGGTATAHCDPRITSVGHFLRHHKLDELPQLINVIRGDMSVVGPRPEVEEHTSVYTDEEMAILSVPPGITDFSSVRFINLNKMLGSEDPNRAFIEKYRDEKNRLRLEYVRRRSFLTDMRILVATIGKLLARF